MYPIGTLAIAHDRAAGFRGAAPRKRGALAVALAARQQDLRARRDLGATAAPAAPAAPVSAAAAGRATSTAAGTAPVAKLTPCPGC
jgi:hypothetical protein